MLHKNRCLVSSWVVGGKESHQEIFSLRSIAAVREMSDRDGLENSERLAFRCPLFRVFRDSYSL
jgi:hypothetical protein